MQSVIWPQSLTHVAGAYYSNIKSATMGVIKFGDIVFNINCTLDTFCPHYVEEHVLLYLEQGMVEITGNRQTVRLLSGDCAFIRKNCDVMMNKKLVDGKPFLATFLNFKRDFLLDTFRSIDKASLPSDVTRNDASVIKLPNNRPDIKSLFDSLKPYFESDIKPSAELLKLKMTEGLYVILNTAPNLYATLFDFTDPWKIDILEFMNQNFRKNLSIKEIANYTGRSLSTFKRDFKKLSKLTPERWIIRRRLEEAQKMLEHRTNKISDICFAVGFKNLSHFSKAYKQMYGVSPINYETV